MTECLLEEIDTLFKDQAFLTMEDVSKLLSCDEQVIYNWTKRMDPKRRPPRIIVGKSIRFPKREFIRWLAKEQGKSALNLKRGLK